MQVLRKQDQGLCSNRTTSLLPDQRQAGSHPSPSPNSEEGWLPRTKNPHASREQVGKGGTDVRGRGTWIVFHCNLVGM